MQLNNLTEGSTHRHKRVGRGGKRGKTAGRGTKGQKARAGHRIRPEFRDTLKKIPKRRGFGKNRARTVNPRRIKPVVISLTEIDRLWKGGEEVTVATLISRGLISAPREARQSVKILGGKTAKALVVKKDILVSKAAKEEIEKAGGRLTA